MAVLDFKEIPEAHKGTGEQDTFELFARDFLSFIGYTIVCDPSRGADGGCDFIVEEKRTGVGGETTIKWLVSCKHKAYSGSAVYPTDEINIRDRVEKNECQGFIGFYSTIASSGLSADLKGLKGKLEYQIFDREKIEDKLLHSSRGLEIAKRYFPRSLAKWRTEEAQPTIIFDDNPSLRCKICNKELLNQKDKGIITLWHKIQQDYEKPKHIEYIFWTCRGRCDDILSKYIRSKNTKLIDGWEDIVDVMIPVIFIKWVMSIMNEQHSGSTYSDEAFNKLKEFLLQLFPYVSRELTPEEKEKIKLLGMIPSYLGGLGYRG